MKISSHKGFTLIELLVVVAIISLLTSVTLASLKSSRERAQNARVLSEKRSIEFAVQLFMTDNGSYPQPGNGSLHCLASSACQWGNATYAPSSAGQLAFLDPTLPTQQETNFALIKKAHALISGNLSGPVSPNPTVVVYGASYRGPLYQCTSPSPSTSPCTQAYLYWTVTTSCPSGTAYISSSTGSVCRSDASGVKGSYY